MFYAEKDGFTFIGRIWKVPYGKKGLRTLGKFFLKKMLFYQKKVVIA